mmetsp:Transcript_11211/g.19678  ORF Transcript_11211/g.19678 Transcript_11211/m.19678 type:complete len:453 (-) Transcript_11211:45-1403(-)
MENADHPAQELILELSMTAPPRLQIASDLHVEFFSSLGQADQDAKLAAMIAPKAPVLALLGDIGIPTHPNYRRFLLQQAEVFEAVLVLAGNHEFYDVDPPGGMAKPPHMSWSQFYACKGSLKNSVQDMTAAMRAICAEHPRLHYVEGTCVRLGKGPQAPALLCTTLWSHIPKHAMREVGRCMNDYAMICKPMVDTDDPHAAIKATGKDGSRLCPLTPVHTSRWHAEAVNWLNTEIARIEKSGGACVGILTHHAPSMRGTSDPKHEGGTLNHAFASDLRDLCGQPAVKFWAYGHTHFNNDQVVQGCRVLSNQLGYEHEATTYRPDFVIDLQCLVAEAVLPSDTTFGRIARKEMPCDLVYEDSLCMCFTDVNPQAKVHLVLIPKDRGGLTGISKAEERHAMLLGHMLVQAGKLGAQHSPEGFRLVVNDGREGCQSIYHLHIHILGGQQMYWPPC